MSPMKNNNNQSSSNHGEVVVRQANVLASCYIVDTAGLLKGLHYCTTGATGAECPPLAAITASNELALLPKTRKRGSASSSSKRSRRGGAALSIREECERFFCERMSAVFQGERNADAKASGLMGVHALLPTPPNDPDASYFGGRDGFAAAKAQHGVQRHDDDLAGSGTVVTAWLEIWDFAGGASFRAFVGDDGLERSLFVFFDGNVVGVDLKKALMALIDLADTPLDCQHLVVCLDRRIEERDAKSLMKSLQWVGFELTTLDNWAKDLDVTSKEWLFMGMEL
ncbi:hypothetical protein BN1708_000624 [Verticillium longisporum]|uniref:Ornithine decarboxylase antizyme n=1 Tax=Verticillium longisporum TaxID=100787 RepID=A0A0G4LZ36_VERLO|nr:hypothetical protein BN1708_000624 [Verticillium longisporum]